MAEAELTGSFMCGWGLPKCAAALSYGISVTQMQTYGIFLLAGKLVAPVCYQKSSACRSTQDWNSNVLPLHAWWDYRSLFHAMARVHHLLLCAFTAPNVDVGMLVFEDRVQGVSKWHSRSTDGDSVHKVTLPIQALRLNPCLGCSSSKLHRKREAAWCETSEPATNLPGDAAETVLVQHSKQEWKTIWQTEMPQQNKPGHAKKLFGFFAFA